MACFAVIFGTRHTDATEHQDGLMPAVTMESVVKLIAFATVGISVMFVLFDGPSDLLALASDNLFVTSANSYETPISRWLMLIALSAFAIIMLPRQFQATVVKSRVRRRFLCRNRDDDRRFGRPFHHSVQRHCHARPAAPKAETALCPSCGFHQDASAGPPHLHHLVLKLG
jgi:hypothetical protein